MSPLGSQAGSNADSELETGALGRVAAIYRYPVRSMGGQSVAEAVVSKLGLVGDRAYSVFDPSDNAMASASTGARKWRDLVNWRAEFIEEPELEGETPAIRLTRSDGRVLESSREGFEEALSEALGRPARMWVGDTRGALSHAAAERHAGQQRADPNTPARATGATMPSVPYASAPLHLLTTASLEAARAAYRDGRFEPERFRPNIVIETPPAVAGFVEKNWLKARLRVGRDEEAGVSQPGASPSCVELSVFEETERCVLTTHAQFDLPKDPLILRTLVEQNRNQMGIYASVSQPGVVRVGDLVSIASIRTSRDPLGRRAHTA